MSSYWSVSKAEERWMSCKLSFELTVSVILLACGWAAAVMIANCELWTANCEFRIANCELRIAKLRSRGSAKYKVRTSMSESYDGGERRMSAPWHRSLLKAIGKPKKSLYINSLGRGGMTTAKIETFKSTWKHSQIWYDWHTYTCKVHTKYDTLGNSNVDTRTVEQSGYMRGEGGSESAEAKWVLVADSCFSHECTIKRTLFWHGFVGKLSELSYVTCFESRNKQRLKAVFSTASSSKWTNSSYFLFGAKTACASPTGCGPCEIEIIKLYFLSHIINNMIPLRLFFFSQYSY